MIQPSDQQGGGGGGRKGALPHRRRLPSWLTYVSVSLLGVLGVLGVLVVLVWWETRGACLSAGAPAAAAPAAAGGGEQQQREQYDVGSSVMWAAV